MFGEYGEDPFFFFFLNLMFLPLEGAVVPVEVYKEGVEPASPAAEDSLLLQSRLLHSICSCLSYFLPSCEMEKCAGRFKFSSI